MKPTLTDAEWDRRFADPSVRQIVVIPQGAAPHLDPIDLPQPLAGFRWETDDEFRKRLTALKTGL